MRSSKQRQRNKQRPNRPTGGNIVNRVFDSSGPDGKVRGTPQQIIEKYVQLHRDAQLSGDRVGAENFAQHAEHYSRMLAEAQREIDRARDEQEQQNRDRQQERDRHWERERADGRGGDGRGDGQRGGDGRGGDGQRDQPRDGRGDALREFQRDGRDGQRFQPRDGQRDGQDGARDRPRFRPEPEAAPPAFTNAAPIDAAPEVAAEPSFLTQPLFPVLVAEPEDDRGPERPTGNAAEPVDLLVDTPEDRPRGARPRRAERRPAEAPAEPAPDRDADPVAADADAGAAPRPRRARRPRAPRPDAAPDAAE